MSPTTVVFVHDHCFLKDGEGNVYSEGKISDGVFARLRPLAEEVVVVSRLKTADCVSGVVPLNGSRIRMAPVDGLRFSQIFGRGIFRNLALIWREIGNARFVVLRLPCLLSVLVAPVLWLRRVPFAVELVGFPRDGLRGKGGGLAVVALGHLLHVLTAGLVSRALGVLYVTQFALQEAFPANGLSVAASNVELPSFPVATRGRAVTHLNDPVRIGLIGGMTTNYKGIDIAINSISLLSRQGYNCELHVLGSGDPDPLRRLASTLGCQGSVFFDGTRMGGAEVREWLSALDMYIQPSRTEGLPRALVEAMSLGLPSVASRVGGIPELLDDCWLVPPGDPVALAERLKLLLGDEVVRQRARNDNVLRSADYSAPILNERRDNFYATLARQLRVSHEF